MKIEIEVSRPHYHPSKETVKKLTLTKKRDLSVPPHWVANERITRPETGHSYAIVMPERDHELWEVTQPVHIHCDRKTYEQLGSVENKVITVNTQQFAAKVKVSDGYEFEPKIHFDHVDAAKYNINPGDYAII